jgi:hypothetical protein
MYCTFFGEENVRDIKDLDIKQQEIFTLLAERHLVLLKHGILLERHGIYSAALMFCYTSSQ